MTVSFGVIAGSAFNASSTPTTTAPVTIKGALPGDKVLNVYVISGPNAPASLMAGDVTSFFGSNLIGSGGLTEIVCVNSGGFSNFGSLSSVVILVSVATTG